MSIITYKITDDLVKVAADGRIVSGDKIIAEDFKKIIKISDSLIIGATGLSDELGIFKKFVEANQYVFEHLEDITSTLPLFSRYRDYLKNHFGFMDETLKELSAHLIANKNFLAIIYCQLPLHKG